jgi:hypothetical protein
MTARTANDKHKSYLVNACELKTFTGKIFAGCYPLFSGVAFLTSIGVVFAPIFHRFLHKFHLESAKEK